MPTRPPLGASLPDPSVAAAGVGGETPLRSWLEIAVAADLEAVEAVAEVLRAIGTGVAIEEPFLQPRLDEPAQPDPSRRAVVRTYLPDDVAAVATIRRIEEQLWHLRQLASVQLPTVRRIDEEDWANSWKSFYPVLHVGHRTVVVPAWKRYRRRPHDVVVRLDPGLAFGTGTHPTTRLCLEAAETLVQPGREVLDVGTGSGILAILAARLGARRVVACDVDEVAVDVARRNVRLNRLSRKVRVFLGSIDSLPPQRGASFDLVLSNVTAKVNSALAPALAQTLRPSGSVVVSGILEDAAAGVEIALQRAGLEVLDTRRDGDWVAQIARLRA